MGPRCDQITPAVIAVAAISATDAPIVTRVAGLTRGPLLAVPLNGPRDGCESTLTVGACSSPVDDAVRQWPFLR